MTPEIAKLLKKSLNCRPESSERVFFAALDAPGQIAKLGKRKKQRPAAIEALVTIAQKAIKSLRGTAASALSELLSPEDTDCLPFLREGLQDEQIDYGCSRGLLNVLGAAAYVEIVPLILDPKRSLDSRSSVLAAICRHSGQPFSDDLPVFVDLKASDLPVDEIRAWQAAGFPAYVPTKIAVPVAALSKLGITLPDDYATFLQQQRKSVTYEYDDGCWDMTPAAQLMTKISVDGQSVPRVQQLKRYVATLRQVLETDATEDHRGKPYPLERLAAGIAIGTDDSGDVLFLDPGDANSVWIFHHDGGDVEKVGKSFPAWLRKADVSE